MMSEITAIKNAQIVLERGILWDGVIIIENGKIKEFGKQQDVTIPIGANIIDARNAYVGPGFVDIHVHGGGGYSTCFESVEAVNHFLEHGETSILSTISYVYNGREMLEAIRSVKEAMKKTKIIKGMYMEGPYMNPNYGANAFKNPWREGVCEKDFIPLVDEGRDVVKIWAIAPEIENIKSFLEYARKVNPDVVFALGHSEATPMQVRALGAKYKPAIMTHITNATGRVPSYSGTRGYGPDEYCMNEPGMYAELISDSRGIHVHPDIQQLVINTKGVHHTILITDSTVTRDPIPAGLEHITDLNFDSKGTIAGSRLTMDQACHNVMQSTNCGIAQAFLMASTNPAKAIGMEEEIGSIDVGKNADLVFVNDRIDVKKVMVDGKIVVEKE